MTLILTTENRPATGLPMIIGTVQTGETLTADTSDIVDEDGLTDVIFSYQWVADDVETQGATSSSYTLSDDEVDKAITVRVRFTDDGGNHETLTSTSTGAVLPAPPIWTATMTPGTLTDGYGYNHGGPGELDRDVLSSLTASPTRSKGSWPWVGCISMWTVSLTVGPCLRGEWETVPAG